MNEILRGFAALLAVSAVAVSCTKTETVYIYPEQGVTRLTVSPLSTNMGYVDDVELTVTVRPSSTRYRWESEDESVAVVDENNRIVPKGVGSTKITAVAGDKRFSVDVTVHSSILGDTFFIDNGSTAKMDNIRILPEGIPYTVTNNSKSLMNVSDDLTVSALAEGIGTLTITTEDNISKTVTVGVTDGKVTTLASAHEYLYEGADLGDGSFNYSVMTFGTADAVYEGDAKWSGAGRGMALKLYRPAGKDIAPDGTYSAGTAEYCFFPDNSSYIVDPATGTKEYLKNGSVIVEGNNVTANVMTTSKAYKFTCTAARPSEKRELLTNYISTIDDDYCNGTSQIFVDTGGTIFYGGYTYCWQLRLANSETNHYLQFFMWGYTDIAGAYSLIGSWGGRGTVWTSVSTVFGTSYREGNSRYTIAPGMGGFTVSNYETDGTNASMDVKGTVYGNANYTYTIPEIGVQNSIPHTIEIDVTNVSLTVAKSRLGY